MTVKLGVPSKGRLMEKTFDWFADRGVTLSRSGSDREYAGSVSGVNGVSMVLLSAGTDLIHEKLPLWDSQVEAVEEMGFGHADLILAVPCGWIDVDLTDDLDAAAAMFRERHGFRLRIATKYHRLVREFLRDAGVADYAIVDSQGATEGTVANGTAEAIADITSSGATLSANHLKILSDGLILASQATLWRSRLAEIRDDDIGALDGLLSKLA